MADGNVVPAAPAADGKLDGKPGEPLKDNPDAGHVTKAEFTALSRTLMSEITSLKSMLPPPKADAKPKTDDAPTLTGQAEELRTIKDGLKAGSKRGAITAAVANKLQGAETGTLVFSDDTGTKTRFTAVVDSDGNRDTITNGDLD